ncbi:MAG: hypothetical protein ACXQTZ_03495, partial [Candidatus Alkanophagales archaeon]
MALSGLEGEAAEIVRLFADAGYQIHPDAIRLLKRYKGSLRELVEGLREVFGDSVLVVEKAHVERLLGEVLRAAEEPEAGEKAGAGSEVGAEVGAGAGVEAGVKARVEVGAELEAEVEVGAELEGAVLAPPPRILKSYGDARQPQQPQALLQQLFLDRYNRISRMIKARVNAIPIKRAEGSSGDSEVAIIGIVSSITKTRKGGVVAELEDPTGTMLVVFREDVALLPDEVVGV